MNIMKFSLLQKSIQMYTDVSYVFLSGNQVGYQDQQKHDAHQHQNGYTQVTQGVPVIHCVP